MSERLEEMQKVIRNTGGDPDATAKYLWQQCSSYDASAHGDHGDFCKAYFVATIAALASEGVVDPERYEAFRREAAGSYAEYERWCDAFHEGSDAVKKIAQETLDLRAKVERLEAQVVNCQDAGYKRSHREGMEQAKILHDQRYFKSAAAIRAEKEKAS